MFKLNQNAKRYTYNARCTNIHKLDEVSNVKESECQKEDNKAKKVEGSDNVTETRQNVIIKVKIEEIESSDEFTSDSGTKKEIDKLIDKLDSDTGDSKKVTFADKPTCIHYGTIR